MLDMAFVEEIIPVLIAESTHPTVKGITLAVISQLGLRGRAAVAAEHRIRPLVSDAMKETFGEDEFDEDDDDDDDENEDDDGYFMDDEEEEDDGLDNLDDYDDGDDDD